MDVSLAATEPDLVEFRNKERGTALCESWLQGRMISSLGTPPPPPAKTAWAKTVLMICRFFSALLTVWNSVR